MFVTQKPEKCPQIESHPHVSVLKNDVVLQHFLNTHCLCIYSAGKESEDGFWRENAQIIQSSPGKF